MLRDVGLVCAILCYVMMCCVVLCFYASYCTVMYRDVAYDIALCHVSRCVGMFSMMLCMLMCCIVLWLCASFQRSVRLSCVGL